MKVPEPRKLPSGKWFIQLRLNGKSIPITCETPTECIRIAELEKAKYMAGVSQIKKLPKNTTLREAMQKYIDAYRSTLSPSTVDRYLFYKDSRFKAYLDKPLGEIKWQKMIDDELKLVSEKTVKNAWGLVRPALKHIEYPVPEIKLAAVPVKEIAYLQPEEIKPFCDAVKGRSYEIAALLGLHGLRMSEVKGLTWDDIDLKRSTIRVSGSYVKGPDGFVDKKTNKNATSTRTVPIMIPQLKKALEAVKNKTGKVVTIYHTSLNADIKRVCDKAKVTNVSFHGLRHSFASLCFHLHIPMEQIQTWGGWSNDATLKKIYIHLSASSESNAKAAFSGFFS